MFGKKQTFPIVDKFFNGNPKVVKCEGTSYVIEAGDMLLDIMVHTNGAKGVSWQTTFTLNGGNVPLNEDELKYMAEKTNEYIRSLV